MKDKTYTNAELVKEIEPILKDLSKNFTKLKKKPNDSLLALVVHTLGRNLYRNTKQLK